MQRKLPREEGVEFVAVDVAAEYQHALARGQAVAVYLSLRADALPQGEYALLRVLETVDGKVASGVTYVLVNAGEKGSEHASNEENAS